MGGIRIMLTIERLARGREYITVHRVMSTRGISAGIRPIVTTRVVVEKKLREVRDCVN